MPGEANKAIVKRYFEELVNKGGFDVVDQILAPDFIFRGPAQPVRGVEAFKQFIQGLRLAFPDLNFKLEDKVTEQDKVIAWFTVSGTHLGPLMGAPPTGKRFSVTGADFFRILDGRIVEVRGVSDSLGQAQQLGLVPSKQ